MEVDVFYCSKPLQFLNIKNLCTVFKGKKVLIIKTNFEFAEDFALKIKEYDSEWESVHIISQNRDIIPLINKYKIKNFFIDSDFGSINLILFYLRFKTKIIVYEEGFGNYRNSLSNLTKGNSFLKKMKVFLFLLLGSGTKLGKSRFTSGLYLYFKDYYLDKIDSDSKKICDYFPLKFHDNLILNKQLFFNICTHNFSTNYTNKRVLLYATSHDFSLSEIDEFVELNDVILIKLHPHIKKDSINIENKNSKIELISGNLPIEFIVGDLVQKNNYVELVHRNSSAGIYSYKWPIKIINKGGISEDYQNLYNYVKTVL